MDKNTIEQLVQQMEDIDGGGIFAGGAVCFLKGNKIDILALLTLIIHDLLKSGVDIIEITKVVAIANNVFLNETKKKEGEVE